MNRRTCAGLIVEKPSLVHQTHILTSSIGEIPLLPTETSFVERYTSKNISIPFGSIGTSRDSAVLQSSIIVWSLFWTTTVVVFLEICLINLTHNYTFCNSKVISLPRRTVHINFDTSQQERIP